MKYRINKSLESSVGRRKRSGGIARLVGAKVTPVDAKGTLVDAKGTSADAKGTSVGTKVTLVDAIQREFIKRF